MGRYNFPAFKTASSQRYVVIWDLQWHLIECERLEPAANLSAAMEATMGRLEVDGWEAEATPEYGFAFIRRGAYPAVAHDDPTGSPQGCIADVFPVRPDMRA